MSASLNVRRKYNPVAVDFATTTSEVLIVERSSVEIEFFGGYEDSTLLSSTETSFGAILFVPNLSNDKEILYSKYEVEANAILSVPYSGRNFIMTGGSGDLQVLPVLTNALINKVNTEAEQAIVSIVDEAGQTIPTTNIDFYARVGTLTSFEIPASLNSSVALPNGWTLNGNILTGRITSLSDIAIGYSYGTIRIHPRIGYNK